MSLLSVPVHPLQTTCSSSIGQCRKGPSERGSLVDTTAMLVTDFWKLRGGLQPPQPPLWIRHCPHLASLHWLPIDSRIKYKLACICYNCMSTNSPPYLSDLLTIYTAARQLRSSSDNSVLRRPSVRTVSYGQRSFSYSAPSAWNSLPQQVRSSDNVSTFRSRTKTHLFRLAY